MRRIYVLGTAAWSFRPLPIRRASSSIEPSNQIFNSVRKRVELLSAIEVADAAADSLAHSPDDKYLLRQHTHGSTCEWLLNVGSTTHA